MVIFHSYVSLPEVSELVKYPAPEKKYHGYEKTRRDVRFVTNSEPQQWGTLRFTRRTFTQTNGWIFT